MAFETVTSADGVAWRRSSLLHAAGVPHAFSTRLGGVSPAPFDSMNLGLADAPGPADSWANVQSNWRRLLTACGLQGRDLVRARQVHGIGVLHGDLDPAAFRPEPPFADADAVVTGAGRQAVSVRVADCAPLLLAEPAAGLVSAVHAGWRGVVQGVVHAAMQAMIERGAVAERVLVAIGPCIGPDRFEVGDDVQQAMTRAGLERHVRPSSGRPGKWLADLRAALQQQVRAFGVPERSIDVSGTCTHSEAGTEFSYRRDGARSGRMAAVIGL